MREQNKGLICSRHEERLACKLAEELPTVWHPAPADSAGEQLINRLRLSSSQSSFTLQSWSVHLEPALLRPGSSPPSFPLPSLCEIGPLNHTVPFHPAPRRHRGVTSARDEFCHKSWLYFMLQCILFTRAKPSSFGTLHQATFPHPNGVSNRNKQIQSQSCFLCKSPWNASKYFFFSPHYLTSPGWQTRRTENVWQNISFHEALKKICKGVSVGVGNSSALPMRKIHTFFFLVVMKFAKLLMSALVSLSEDLVPVELFHLSC